MEPPYTTYPNLSKLKTQENVSLNTAASSWIVKNPVRLNGNCYKTKLCPLLQRRGECERDRHCVYAHSLEELRSIPDLRNTRLCSYIRRGEECPVPTSCPFAHHVSELRHTEDLYKTKMCHMWRKGKCSAGVQCRHAHGCQELARFRRIAKSAKGRLLEESILSACCARNNATPKNEQVRFLSKGKDGWPDRFRRPDQIRDSSADLVAEKAAWNLDSFGVSEATANCSIGQQDTKTLWCLSTRPLRANGKCEPVESSGEIHDSGRNDYSESLRELLGEADSDQNYSTPFNELGRHFLDEATCFHDARPNDSRDIGVNDILSRIVGTEFLESSIDQFKFER